MTYFIDTSDKRNQIVKTLYENLNKPVADISNFQAAQPQDILIFAPNKKFETCNLQNLPNNTILVCGNLPINQQKILCTKKIKHINVLSNQVFSMQNAILTAEGILENMIAKSPISIFKQKILILGFGRVGKATSKIFAQISLDFAVCSHNEDNFALSQVFTPHTFFAKEVLPHLHTFDVIINTIPATIFNADHLKQIKPSCLFLEIASIQSIVNSENLQFEYLQCPALPQKFSATTAGTLLFECIEKMLK